MPPINISLDESFPPLLFVFLDYFFFLAPLSFMQKLINVFRRLFVQTVSKHVSLHRLSSYHFQSSKIPH